MLYSCILRPLLFQLDAEQAHDFALACASRFAQSRVLTSWLHSFTACQKPLNKAGLLFPNPIGLAGGLDKNGVATRAWWAAGFGFVELGTVTPRPQAGNAKPRMARLPQSAAIINRMGFNNKGAEALAQRLKDLGTHNLRPAFPIGVSIGKNATTPNDQAVEDYVLAGAMVAPVADFISINVSSPNTSGLRTLQNPADLTRLVSAVVNVSAGKPVLVKLAPELEGDVLNGVLDAVLAAGAKGIIATNTLAQFDAKTGKPKGGLSGRPLKFISPARIAEVRKRVGPEVLLIGCGGVEDVPTARAMVAAGADLVQIYTALVYKGPFLAGQLARGVK